MPIKGTVKIGGERTPVPNFNALLAPIQNQMAQNNQLRMAQAMKNMDRQYTEQESIRRENRQEDRLIDREGRAFENAEGMAKLNYRLQDERQHQILTKDILRMAESDPNLFEGIQGALNDPFLNAQPPGGTGAGGLASFSTPELQGIFDQMSGSVASRDEYRNSYQQYQQSSPADQVAAGAAFNRDPQDLRYPHGIGDGGHTPYVNPNPGLLPPLPYNSPRSNANLGAQGLREVNQLGDRRDAAIPSFHKRIAEAYSALGMPFDAEALMQNSNVGDLQNLDSELQQRVRYHGELARTLDASGYQSDPHTFNDIPMEELQALLFQPGATGGGRDAFQTYAGMPTNPGIPAPARSLSKLRDQYATQHDFVGTGPYRKFAGDWRADTAVRDHAESLDTYRGELETLWKTETTKSKKVIDELEVAAIRAYKEDSLDFEDDDSSKPTRQDEAPQPGTPEARAITLDYLFREGNAATVKAWQELSTENSRLVDLKDRYTKAYATARGALLQAKGTPALWAQLRPETQKQLRMALLGKAYTSTGTVQARRPRP
jgi:plasmid stabilization system protein ParE